MSELYLNNREWSIIQFFADVVISNCCHPDSLYQIRRLYLSSAGPNLTRAMEMLFHTVLQEVTGKGDLAKELQKVEQRLNAGASASKAMESAYQAFCASRYSTGRKE